MVIIKILKHEGQECIRPFKYCSECPFYTSYEYTEYGELTGYFDASCGLTGTVIYEGECIYDPEVKDKKLDNCPIASIDYEDG
jgi:hypothetical protein